MSKVRDGAIAAGLLSARPSASAVYPGALYAATDTGLIYRSDGVSTWSTWVDPFQANTSPSNDVTLQANYFGVVGDEYVMDATHELIFSDPSEMVVI